MNHPNRPRLLMAASMTIFGTLGLFVRYIPISSGALALCRAVLAAGLIGLGLLLTGQSIPFSAIRREFPLLLLSGAALGINWMLLFEAYRHTTVTVATLCYYFAPVIVTAVCPVLFRERLTAKQLVCFGFSTAGLILITLSGGSSGSGGIRGILFGLAAACFYAAVVLLNKYIQNVSGLPRTFLQFLAASAVMIPYVMLTGGLELAELDSTGWANLLIVGLVHTGLAYCLYFSALRDIPGQKAAILSYIDPLVAVIISVTALGEPLTGLQLLGGGLILGFTLYNELSP